MTLTAHTAEVLAAAQVLLDERARDTLVTLGLPPSLEQRLRRLVLLSCFIHDLGKCSDHFQRMVRGAPIRQLVRHEALSMLLVTGDGPLRRWLEGGLEHPPDLWIAAVAAAGHHRKFTERAVALEDSGAEDTLRCLIDHKDFRVSLLHGCRLLGLPEPPTFSAAITFRDSWRAPLSGLLEEAEDDAAEALEDDPVGASLLPAVKALVLASDVAGSAMSRTQQSYQWIRDQLNNRASAAQLREVASRRLSGNPPRPFQVAVAASAAPVTLLKAGCGTGKTVAAYLWAAQHAPRQIWFCYPTTGTATEGFRDYLNDAEIHAVLEHGRREVDVEMLGLAADSHDLGTNPRDWARLQSLHDWGAMVASCTVDTVLGLVQNNRKGLYAWPGLACSAVVFDEIHDYDDRLFGSLLRFLRACPGIPALLMTASLPEHRMRCLEALVRAVHGPPLAALEGPEELERIPRYQRLHAEDPWPEVLGCMERGGKVLWVSNTVRRCLEVADAGRGQGVEPLIYHSRFRYEDRVARHKAVIAAFSGAGPCLAVTTQVAEMSLDLDADLLVTDQAPISAMIQRLGRLNRRIVLTPPGPMRPFIVLQPPSHLPYEQPEFSQAEAWLQAVGVGPLSQRDLAAAWQSFQGGQQATSVGSTWLDGGFHTRPDDLRGGNWGVTVILPGDMKAVQAGLPIARVTIPMPPPPVKQHVWQQWREGPYIVPPAGRVRYDPLRGAQWQ